jgi:hypothetical protein
MRWLFLVFLLMGIAVAAMARTRHIHLPQQIDGQSLAAPIISQPPSPHPAQQQSSPDERGTKKNPFVVETYEPAKSQEEIDRTNKREIDKIDLDRKLVDFTGDLARYTKLLFAATVVLAVVAGILVVFGFAQLKELKQSTIATQDAARAAANNVKLGRDEFNASHRPTIMVREFRITSPSVSDDDFWHFRAADVPAIAVVYHLPRKSRTLARPGASVSATVA